MQLRRIEVRDFRKLHHVVVEGLQDGLNVVVGDNEAGKSTLLAALRAVLFERHRVGGKVAQAMLPFGQSVRPEVALDFELGGEPWTLRKAFVQRPEAELVGPRERLTGDAVEDRLSELLGFTPPGAGGSKPSEHQGAYGLLWVQQGTAHEGLGMGAGRDSIASALETEVGQVLGGERGRALLGAAEKRRHDFWTKLDKPRGTWKETQAEVEALEAQRADLLRRFEAYDGKIAELEARQEALARHEREGTQDAAAQDLAAARAAMAETSLLEQALREAEARRKLAHATRDAAAERRAGRAALLARTEAARRAIEEAQAESEALKGVLRAHEAEARAAADRLAEQRGALARAGDRVVAAEQALRLRAAREELDRLEDVLGRAEAADERRREALAEAGAVSLSKAALREIEALQTELDRATAQRQAASVRLDFAPEGGRAVRIEGQAQEAGVPAWLSRDADIELEGFGRLRVHPGGGAGDLARQAEAAARALEDRLKAHRLSDLAGARAELQRKAAAEGEAASRAALLDALAPKGLDALRQAAESQRALLARPVAEEVAALAGADEAVLEDLRRARDAMAAASDLAEAEARRAEAARVAADRDLAGHEGRATGLARDHDGLVRELAQARTGASDDDLDAAQAQAEAEREAAERAEARARSAVEVLDPEAVRLELRRAERTEEAIRLDIDRLRRERRDLEVELGALGREGVGEQLAEAEGKLALRRRQLAAQGEEAAASRLLHEALMGAQRESKDRWLGPVRERVRPYLRLLQPDSDVILNEETLELESMRRGDREEPFGALSVGAREQVAVITRLALADILRGSNRPSAVILDDALVNTDEARLRRMHLVLHKAAESLQVLVLTCRERDFLQLGAPLIRMR